MKPADYRISLDILESQSQYSLPMKQGDNSRVIYITLREGSIPYEISGDCFAVFSAKKPDGNILENNCIIKENTIIYAITEQTTSVSGLVDCEIKLYGANNGFICSARFSIIVDPRAVEDKKVESTSEFSALTQLYSDVVTSENARVGAEELRAVAENAREFAESGRVEAETIRALSEDERKASEETRNQNFEQIMTKGTAGIEALGQATKNANNIVANIQQKLDNGDFVGEKGEKGDKGDKGDTPAIDQVYNPTSENAQSGIAVEEATRKAKYDVANAIKGFTSGEIIRVDDISPIEHNSVVWIHGKNILNGELLSGVVADNKFNVYEQTVPNVYKTTKTFLKAGVYTISFSRNVNIVRTVIDGVWKLASSTNLAYYTFETLTDGYVGFSFRDSASITAPWSDTTLIQIEEGNTATDYEPYIDPTTVTVTEETTGATYTPNADGICEIVSVSPNMTLSTDTDGVTINCEYNKDTNKVVESLVNAIISLGGNV